MNIDELLRELAKWPGPGLGLNTAVLAACDHLDQNKWPTESLDDAIWLLDKALPGVEWSKSFSGRMTIAIETEDGWDRLSSAVKLASPARTLCFLIISELKRRQQEHAA